jgi:hypothetical protein
VSAASTKLLIALGALGVVGATTVYAPIAQAFNFGDMMNPGRWMGGGRDDDWDDYGPGPYGGGPYGGGPWGPGYGGPGGPYGPGAYGPGPYGAGPYGAPGYGGAPAAAPAAPAPKESTSSNTKSAEIEALKRRIDELEARQGASTPPPASDWAAPAPPPASDWSAPSSPPTSDWGSAPAFRPMDRY